MTIRAVFLGLLGAFLLCAATFFNDMVMRGTFLVGNFFPITVFGSLILFLIFINPLLRLIGRKAPLSGRELSLIIALILFACYVPGRGLMHQFTTFLMMPHHYQKITPGWQGEPTKISREQILDWAKFVETLRQSENDGEKTAGGLFWQQLDAEQREFLQGLSAKTIGNGEKQQKLLELTNVVLAQTLFAEAIRDTSVPLPNYAEMMRKDCKYSLSDEAEAALPRAAFDVFFADSLKARKPPVLAHVPPRMLADKNQDEDIALDGFVNGLGTGDESISFDDVPWSAWKRTLRFWMPLIATLCAGVIGLSLVIHRQWAHHERLPYPTIEFAQAILPVEGQLRNNILHNRLFWIGTLFVFLMHMNNYACRWWPEFMVPVRLRFNFYPLLEIVPIFRRSGVGIWTMFYPTIFFTVIGFAYFLSTDISLSLGIAPYVYAIFTGILAGYGVSANGAMLQPYIGSFFYAGGYAAMFLVLMYIGRQYFGSVIRRSFGMKSGDHVDSHAVWGARVFFAAVILFIVQLSLVGLKWQLAALYTLIMTVLFVVISRLLAEAGVFYLHSYFFPCAVLWGFLGAKAIGPDQLLIMSMLSSVLLIDPREAFMPFVVSALRLTDQAKLKLGRTAGWGMIALLLGLAAALPMMLYLQYQHGAIRAGDGWTASSVPRFAFNASNTVRNTLDAQGVLPVRDIRSGWQRLLDAKPTKSCVFAFCTTFVLVIVFTMARYRFAWWPVHPLLFLVLATWQSRLFAFSFFLGWIIKRMITKYGGGEMYQKLKPLMIGLVAGEMLAGVIPMIIGVIYYMIQGEPPRSFAIYR